MRSAILRGTVLALVALPVGFAAPAAAQGSPSVTTGSSSAITSNAATVSGSVNPNGQSTLYAFQYGTSAAFGHETTLTSAGSVSTSTAVSARIGGLLSGTTYHYRIIAISDGGTSTGGDLTFKTSGTPPPPPATKPTATTGTANAGVNGASVSATINPNSSPTTYYFEFGTTSAYGYQTAPASAGPGALPVSVTASLGGLQSDQTYHYRIVAFSRGGTTLGADATFKTTKPPPGASTLSLFGHTGFVAPQGVGGIFLGCIGGTTCTGKLLIQRGGATLGQRGRFTIGPNTGGIVHYTLSRTGQSLLRRLHHMRVTIVVTPTGAATFSGGVTLVPFS